jgi:hypothetical protein
MLERPRAVARDVLSRRRWKLRADYASFDDEILCECASGGGVTCDGVSAEREASQSGIR